MQKPLASIVLLTFNQERYVEAAIRSAFAQTYRPFEIVVSDDASTDATWQVVESLVADCPPDVVLTLRRNATNLGIAAHLDVAFAQTQGEIVLAFAGDDVSVPDRVAVTVRAFADANVFATTAGQVLIDADSNEIGFEDLPPPSTSLSLARSGHTATSGAAAAYRREVFTAFGPMPVGLMYEDIVLFFRATLLGRVADIPERLVLYRHHSASVMGRRDSFENATVFAGRARRHIENVVVARRQQLTDARAAGARQEVIDALLNRLREESFCLALIRRDFATIIRNAHATLHMPIRQAVRATAMHAFPRLWHRWIKRAK